MQGICCFRILCLYQLSLKTSQAHQHYFPISVSAKAIFNLFSILKPGSIQIYLKLHLCCIKFSFTHEFITLVALLVLLQLSLSSPLWSWWLISLLDQCYEIFSADFVIHILMMDMSGSWRMVMICFEALFWDHYPSDLWRSDYKGLLFPWKIGAKLFLASFTHSIHSVQFRMNEQEIY